MRFQEIPEGESRGEGESLHHASALGSFCVSGGHEELHFPMPLSNGSDVIADIVGGFG